MQAECQREAVGHTVNAPSRTRGLRPAWRPGQSGNPKGRPSHRKLFEEAFGRAVAEHAEAIVAALVKRALDGDGRMMAALLDRVLPRITHHEIEAEGAPTKMVIEFAGAREELARRIARLEAPRDDEAS